MVLIGIFVVIVGFALKLDSIAVIIISALTTGFAAHMDITEILSILAKTFVNQRLITIFILTLPIIGISERYGLKEKAVELIKNIKNLSTGKLLTLYCLIRQIAGAMSLRISGHPQFVRPLVEPMAQAAAKSKYKKVDVKDEEAIKALSAASENYGNFYGQNLFSGSSGVLLIASTLTGFGYTVSELDIAKASIIMAVIAFLVSAIQNYLFDKKLSKKYSK